MRDKTQPFAFADVIGMFNARRVGHRTMMTGAENVVFEVATVHSGTSVSVGIAPPEGEKRFPEELLMRAVETVQGECRAGKGYTPARPVHWLECRIPDGGGRAAGWREIVPIWEGDRCISLTEMDVKPDAAPISDGAMGAPAHANSDERAPHPDPRPFGNPAFL